MSKKKPNAADYAADHAKHYGSYLNSSELIQYTTAEELANTYQAAIVKIREHAAAIGAASDSLVNAFGETGRYRFSIHLSQSSYSNSSTIDASDANQVDAMIERMKRAAWGAIIEKLAIKRLMSAKRVKELDEALDGRSKVEWPEISADTIRSVAAGYVGSANEFLEEAIREEYDFWKPWENTKYKTNSKPFKLGKKVIKQYMVELGWSRTGYRLRYDRSNHITALDSIFNMLAGNGPVRDYKGALATAIEAGDSTGSGETEFFKFKCYKNGNLHLEFRRSDLLDMFNRIAGRNRLDAAA